MSEILFIALLLVVPVIIVIAFLKYSHKKQRKKAQDRILAYLYKILEQTEVLPDFQIQLVHQLVIVDEKNRKLLIIEHRNDTFSHDVLSLDEIRRVKVVHIQETIVRDEKKRKSETFTTHIGVEIATEEAGAQQLLISYDHVAHDIYRMAEQENEARQLQQRIAKAINVKPVKV